MWRESQDLVDAIRDLKNTTSLPTAFTTATAGEDLDDGEIVAQCADGKVYWVSDPSVPGSLARPFSLASDLINGYLAPATTAGATAGTVSGNDTISRVTTLPNGNIVIAWVSSAGAMFALYSPVGQLLAGPTLALSGVGGSYKYSLSVVGFVGGSFALGGGSAGPNPLGRVAVFDGAGAPVGSIATLDATTGVYDLKLLALPNGNFVASWVTASGPPPTLYFALFNNLGVQQGAATNLGTIVITRSGGSAPGQATLRLRNLVGGVNWAIAYENSPGTSQSGVYLGIYTQTGAVVRAPAVLSGFSAGPTFRTMWYDIVAAKDGGIGIAAALGSDSGSTVSQVLLAAKYSGTGVLVGAIRTLRTLTDGQVGTGIAPVDVSALDGGGFLVVNRNGSAFEVAEISAAGTVAKALALVGLTAITGVARAVSLQGGALAIVGVNASYKLSTSLLTLVLNVWTASPAVALDGVTAIGTNGAAHVALMALSNPEAVAPQTYAVVAAMTPDSGTGAATFHLLNGLVQRRFALGVVVGAVVKNAVARIQALGAATIKRTFGAPYKTPDPGSGFAGQSFKVIGNLAIIKDQ